MQSGFLLLLCILPCAVPFGSKSASASRRPSTLSSFSPGGGEESKVDFSSFNPFDYKKETDNSGMNFSANQISLRKTRMQEIVNELLNVVGDSDRTRSILEENTDFLLDPLDDDQAVLDPDSIYTSTMSRDERYQAYEISMTERLATARNSSVKMGLSSLKDYVLSRRS